MKTNKTCLCKELLEMSTAQLDEKLQQELQSEEPEEEVVLGILRILEEREADAPALISREVSSAWGKYNKRIAPPKKTDPGRKWFVGVAAAAAVICIMIIAIPQTVGAESIWDVFSKWTESIFEFFTPEQDATNPAVEYIFETDNPGLQQLYDTVTELGAAEPVVPMWVPDGYVLAELKSTPMPDGSKVYAMLQSGDSTIILAYRISEELMPMRYEKEDSAVEAYECSDVCHYIMDNEAKLSATWTVTGVECSISADLEREVLYKIIDSIYRKELS